MKYKKFLPLILLLFLIPVAFSLNVYIRPPRMIARMNVTPGRTSTYESFLEVKNQNNFTVNVTLEPQGDLVGKIEISESLVILEPEESRNIDFTISLKEPGTYQGTVLVVYSAEDMPAVGLQADIIVVASEVEGKPENNLLKYSIIGFIVLIIIILVLFVFKKGGVKK